LTQFYSSGQIVGANTGGNNDLQFYSSGQIVGANTRGNNDHSRTCQILRMWMFGIGSDKWLRKQHHNSLRMIGDLHLYIVLFQSLGFF
jgi:hypothetical protein